MLAATDAVALPRTSQRQQHLSSDTTTAQEALTFADLGLSPKVLSAVTDAGYTQPTPIQAGAIPHALLGKDILGIAQTGTGKTASFVLPMLTRLEKGRARARMPRTLILEPTRELAAQVEENFVRYGKNHKLNIALLIGGVSFDEQDKKLERGADVLIATPGRLLDHFERGKLLLNGVQKLVIDEADRMLDMGFIPDIERICKLLPATRQTLFFSATMPPEIKRLTEQFLRNPERIEVSKPATAATTIEQKVVGIPSHDAKVKREALRRIIRSQTVTNALIFCNRKRDVDIVYKSLVKHGFSIGVLHGDLPQPVRTKTLEGFRAGEYQLMVASDVAARGLDLPQVSHVFNYDVPIHADDYIHRIGRTGRAGRTGHAFMLAAPSDHKFLAAIERLTGIPLVREEMPGLEGITSGPSERHGGRDRDRDRRGGRGRHGERKSHPVVPHGEVAAMEPVDPSRIEQPRVAEVSAERTPQEHKPREPKHHEHKPREHKPREHQAHERKAHEPKAPDHKVHEHKAHEHKPREDKPREHKPRHSDTPKYGEPERAASSAQQKGKPEKRKHEGGGGGDKGNDGNKFGDQAPAFLLKPVPKHLLRSKKTEAA